MNENNTLGLTNSNPHHVTLEEARSQEFIARNLEIEPWRIVATIVGFPIECLCTAEAEILDVFNRVIIEGKGWGKRDTLRGIRYSIPLSPRKLSRHGTKKCPRTYQRAIRRLESLGLLVYVVTGSDQVHVYSPAWWVASSIEEAQQVWRQAAAILQGSENNSPLCRAQVAPLSTLCRTCVAPPVTNDADLSSHITDSCAADGATSASTVTDDVYDIDD